MTIPRVLSSLEVWACGCLALVVLAGCSGSAKRPAVAPASGVVTYNGNPVANAEVTFLPAGSDSDIPATGRTDQSGVFQLGTFEIKDGCVPGDKVVVIVADERGGKKIQPGEPEPGMPGYVKPRSLIPARYADAATSGLTATVAAGTENVFNFNLTDDKK